MIEDEIGDKIMKEIKVESEITEDVVYAREAGVGIYFSCGWLEKNKALEYVKKLLDALIKD